MKALNVGSSFLNTIQERASASEQRQILNEKLRELNSLAILNRNFETSGEQINNDEIHSIQPIQAAYVRY